MGFGLRAAALATAAILAGGLAARSPADDAAAPGPPVRLTVEVTWQAPDLPALPDDAPPPAPTNLDLEVPGGRVLGAVAWPQPVLGGPEPLDREQAWRLGTARRGRVRARVEAPLGGSLVIRAGPHATAFSVTRLTETPQETAAGAPVSIQVARVAWDALEIDQMPATDGAAAPDGVVVPGAAVPIRVGFNLLTAEPWEGVARLTAELRPARDGAEPVWRYDQSHVVATDPAAGSAPCVTLTLLAPREEGSYVLAVRTHWRPVVGESSSRLGRLIGKRRRDGPNPITVDREVSLVVLGPSQPGAARGATPSASSVAVETIDLARVRGPRPSATGRAPAPAPGRAAWPVPEAAMVEAAFRDRLRGWVPWGADAALLPPADSDGLAWVALGLNVSRPGRPHRLTVSVVGGEPSALGVALLAPGGGEGGRPRVVLDACATGPAIADGSAPASFSWPIWPDAPEPVLVLVNRGPQPVRLGSVTVEELPGDLPATVPAGPPPDPPRRVGLVLSDPEALGRFGPRLDPLTTARNLGAYLDHIGATVAVLPEALACDRARRRALGGQAGEDALGPEPLAIVLRRLAERRQEVVLELPLDGPLAGLPGPATPEASRRGLVRVDGRGRADGSSYTPLHPDVRAALTVRAVEAIAVRKDYPNLLGLLVRLGPGASLAGPAESGLDDDTFGRFLGAMLESQAARQVPGRDPKDPNRFAARRQYVAGPGRAPWWTWRAREVGAFYADLARAVRAAAPGAVLAVATPTLDDGPAGREARRADSAADSPLSAWKAVGLDLDAWPRAGAEGPIVLRGVGPALDPLAQDLATHPDLDGPVARRPARGMLLLAGDPRPAGAGEAVALTASAASAGEEPLGHALAALDAHWLLFDAARAAGREARLGALARVVRAWPAAPEPASRPLEPGKGVAARTWAAPGQTILGLANDTPYTLTVESVLRGPAAPVDDLGRGLRLEPKATPNGRSVVLELPPFGSAALRIGGEVKAGPVTLFRPELVDAQYQALAARLNRVGPGGGPSGPPNPGFEPARPGAGVVAEIRAGARPVGWTANEAGAVELDAARPHAGAASLRLEARAAGAWAAGAPFAPPPGPELEVRAWLRTEPPGVPVRIWIEGQAAGKSVARRAEVTPKADWTEQRLRVPGLPEAGLDRLRLRFELGAAGRLWIDDLAVIGTRLSEPDARAKTILLKAKQAYREDRIADFARLANSPWARPAAAAPEPAPMRTGQSPAGRRLR